MARAGRSPEADEAHGVVPRWISPRRASVTKLHKGIRITWLPWRGSTVPA
jgi:hypothetical protein